MTASERIRQARIESEGLGDHKVVDATITEDEFERKQMHDQAGYGTPLRPEAPGVWWMYLDPIYGTTLVTGGRIVSA